MMSSTETHTRVVGASHVVLMPVRKDDDITLFRPVPLTAFDRDPAPSRGDDVEVEQPLSPRAQDAGHEFAGGRLVLPGLRVLATQEDGTLQPQPVERVIVRAVLD